MDYPSDPESPASGRRSGVLQKFYHRYPPPPPLPTFPSTVYQPLPATRNVRDQPKDISDECLPTEHVNYERMSPLAHGGVNSGASDVTMDNLENGSIKESHQQYPLCDCCPIPTSHPPASLPRVTPPSTSGRQQIPLAAIPFFENLNTPSPPRRAEHLVNRKTRFEREMDNLDEEKEKQKEKSSQSKKPSALEGAEADDKYVGPWVLGKMVGKGASGGSKNHLLQSMNGMAKCDRPSAIGKVTLVTSVRRHQDRAQRQLQRRLGKRRLLQRTKSP